MTVIAEFETAEIVDEVFKRSRNLSGTITFLEGDPNSKKQSHKKAMLQLRRRILDKSQKHRVSVLNKSMPNGSNGTIKMSWYVGH